MISNCKTEFLNKSSKAFYHQNLLSIYYLCIDDPVINVSHRKARHSSKLFKKVKGHKFLIEWLIN